MNAVKASKPFHIRHLWQCSVQRAKEVQQPCSPDSLRMIPSARTLLWLPFWSGDGWMRQGVRVVGQGGTADTALHCCVFIVLNCHGNWKQMYLGNESVQHSGPRCHPVNYTSLCRWRTCPPPCCPSLSRARSLPHWSHAGCQFRLKSKQNRTYI